MAKYFIREANKEYKNLGMDFAYSLSNRAEVVKAHESFGFRKIGVLSVYARPYKLTKIAGHIIKGKILNIIIRPGLFIAEKALYSRTFSVKGNLMVKELAKFDSNIDRNYQFCSKKQNYTNYRFHSELWSYGTQSGRNDAFYS